MNEARAMAPVTFVGAEVMRQRVDEVLETVARRAFEIFEGNGHRHGHDVDDWLQAEAELLQPVHLDLSEIDGMLNLRAEAPGFKRKDIQVSLEPRRVTISASRESTAARPNGKAQNGGGRPSQALRAIDLPTEVDTADRTVRAAFGGGVLTITLSKRR